MAMQDRVREFAEISGFTADAQSRYVDLVSEVGELGKEILLATDYGKQAFHPTGAFADEMGDCLFSLLCLCNMTGIDAEAALDAALEKYGARLNK